MTPDPTPIPSSGITKDEHDELVAAERALADQLADALRDEARNHELRGGASDALDAYREARRG